MFSVVCLRRKSAARTAAMKDAWSARSLPTERQTPASSCPTIGTSGRHLIRCPAREQVRGEERFDAACSRGPCADRSADANAVAFGRTPPRRVRQASVDRATSCRRRRVAAEMIARAARAEYLRVVEDRDALAFPRAVAIEIHQHARRSSGGRTAVASRPSTSPSSEIDGGASTMAIESAESSSRRRSGRSATA